MEENKLRPGTGFVFRVKNKKTAKSPDIHLRFMNTDGTELRMVGWEKFDRNKELYYSIEKSKNSDDQIRS